MVDTTKTGEGANTGFESFGIYRVILTEDDWDLTDLYEFPHLYEQCYSFVYCFGSRRTIDQTNYIETSMRSLPWKGGFSYVSMYHAMHKLVPYSYRPKIRGMYKGSPGYIDIGLWRDIAAIIALSVTTLSTTLIAATKTYTAIRKLLGEAELVRKSQLAQSVAADVAMAKSMRSLAVEMAKYLGFTNLKALQDRAGSAEIALKLIAAHFRRLKGLAEFVVDGKVVMPLIEGHEPDEEAEEGDGNPLPHESSGTNKRD